MQTINRFISSFRCIALLVALASPFLSMSQFVGDYAPENWTFTSQDLIGQTADGSIDLTNMPNGFTIVGNDDGLTGANSLYTITVPADGTLKFRWSYTTNDGPFYDKAAYRLNGEFFELTDPQGDSEQAGDQHVAVVAGDIFSFVMDATDACCGRGFLTIEAFSTADNTLPTIDAVSNIFSNSNPGQIDVDLEGITAGIMETDQAITITATSSNPSVIPNPSITYTSPETTGTLSFTPVTDAFGDATITVNVMDDGGTANGSIDNINMTFDVSIASNLPPNIDVIADIESQINELINVDLVGIDAGVGETQTVSITATSSNQAVIADEDIVVTYTSPNTTGTLEITPATNISGEATITITVSDDGGTGDNGKNETTTFFNVTIAPNGQPAINDISDLNLFVNAGEQSININGINDGDGEVEQTITITASSSNEALIPEPVVTYTSPNATGTLTFTPAADQFGTSVLTVTVSDNAGIDNEGLDATTTTFLVTVLGNFPPQINELNNIQIGINEPDNVIDLTGITAGVAASGENITVTATSSNQEVIAEAGIEVTYTSPEETGTLTINPVADALGESTITVTVTDDGVTDNGGINTIQETFVIRTIANRAPSINELDDLGLDINADEQTVNLSGINSGEDSDYQTLTVTATSDNPNLIPDPVVTYTSSNATGTLTITPVTDALGTANVTVTVTDDGGTLGGGVNTASTTFEVSVSGNQAPTVNEITDIFRTNADAFTVNLNGISDGTGLVQTLTITASSDNPTIIPDPVVNYTAGSATGSLNFTPTDFGNAVITITITDDGGTENGGVDTFTQTFNISLGGNQAPSISNFLGNIDVDGGTFYFNNGQGDQAIIFNVEDDDHNIINVSVSSLSPEFEDIVSVNFNSGSFLGGIIFSPATGQTGIGEFEVTVQDDGGTENNGVDTYVTSFTAIFTEPTTYTASISDDEAANHVQPFTISQSGPVFIENFEENFGEDLDAFFNLYEKTYDPQNPGSNRIGQGNTIGIDLEKDVQYILVTTTAEGGGDDLLVAAAVVLSDESTETFTNAIGVLDGSVGFGFLPNLDFIEDVTTDEDESFTVSLSGITDGNGGTDNLSLSGTSVGIDSFEFTEIIDGNATATLTPVPDFDTNTSVTITVNGQDGSTFDRIFEMTVNPINDAPRFALDNQTIDEEVAFVFDASGTDVDNDDNALKYSLDAASENLGMSIDASTGSLSWTPTEDQDGTYAVTITANDGSLDGSTTIAIIVEEVNLAPALVAIGDQVGAEKSELTFTVNATDADLPANTLEFSLDATSTGNGMTINASTGVFSWTPTFEQAGSYSVEVSVSDGGLNDTETITITIDDVLSAELVNAIEVYPNPTIDYLEINSNQASSIQIFDLNGAILQEVSVKNRIDVTNLKTGVYMLRLINKEGNVISTNRIVKQ